MADSTCFSVFVRRKGSMSAIDDGGREVRMTYIRIIHFNPEGSLFDRHTGDGL